MTLIWTPNGTYSRSAYSSESDLESAILQVQGELFGTKRIYLDVKKKIGAKGSKQNIPDGYLIDLSGTKPRLFVVENELAAHDPLRHIAVQILEFSLSYESEPRIIKSILYNALKSQPSVLSYCEDYALSHSYRNLDHMLEYLVFESPFYALVIIDEMPDNLETILAKKFSFGVEVLQLTRYESISGERFYHFEPFLADLVPDIAAGEALSISPQPPVSDLDTIVVPAREDGFQETFIGKNCWHEVRIHGSMRPQIKFCAVYRVRPLSAITHIAKVASIEPYKDTGKFIIYFSEPAYEISPIFLAKGGRVKQLQNIRYTTLQRLQMAKTLDDIW